MNVEIHVLKHTPGEAGDVQPSGQTSKRRYEDDNEMTRNIKIPRCSSYGRDHKDGPTTYEDIIIITQRPVHDIIQWLQDHHLLTKQYECPKCKNPMRLAPATGGKASNDGFEWVCQRTINGVRHKVTRSLRKGSWFERSNLTLGEAIKLTYFWTRRETQGNVQHELKFSNKTTVDWYNYCREVTVTVCMNQGSPIGGEDVEVEIDESKVGKRKYHKGHMVEGQWVFGGCEKYDSDKIFLVPVPARDKGVLLPLIEKWIRPRSNISSDCWAAYNDICELPEEYSHHTVNHSKEYKAADGTCTNTIEGTWRHMKRSLPPACRQGFYTGYLAEYLWRKKNKKTRDLFMQFIEDIAKCEVFQPKTRD